MGCLSFPIFHKYFAFFFLLLLFLPHHGEADNPLPFATVQFPPFTYMQDGKVTGVATEIVRTVVERMGYTPQFEIYPTKRAKNMAKTGRVAGLFTITKNAERQAMFHFSRPLAVIQDVFFKNKKRAIDWTHMGDLKPYIVGATDGYNYAPVFLKALRDRVFRAEMIASHTPELQHLRKLASGRIDLAICEINVCNHIIRQWAPTLDSIDFIQRYIGPVRTFHIGFTRQWPDAEQLVKRFNQELEKFRREGGLKRIYKAFGVLEFQSPNAHLMTN
ncbi:MAG: transporter substrate-binding domain-containing protein [Magnetococcales bacterium]|nr:transporter substrate-binding domain-containing protein [Magnetococcales bacterium]